MATAAAKVPPTGPYAAYTINELPAINTQSFQSLLPPAEILVAMGRFYNAVVNDYRADVNDYNGAIKNPYKICGLQHPIARRPNSCGHL